MRPITKTRMPEKTALTILLGPVMAAIIVFQVESILWSPMKDDYGFITTLSAVTALSFLAWWGILWVLDKVPSLIKTLWPETYRKHLIRDVYLPSTAYTKLKKPLLFEDDEIPYNTEGLRGYPLKIWVEKFSYRQLRACKGRRGVLKYTNPYVRAILLSRIEWREQPAAGMETGYEYRKRSLHCGDLLEEPTEASLFKVVWDRRKRDWGVIDLHEDMAHDDFVDPMTSSLPLFLNQWEGFLRVLG